MFTVCKCSIWSAEKSGNVMIDELCYALRAKNAKRFVEIWLRFGVQLTPFGSDCLVPKDNPPIAQTVSNRIQLPERRLRVVNRVIKMSNDPHLICREFGADQMSARIREGRFMVFSHNLITNRVSIAECDMQSVISLRFSKRIRFAVSVILIVGRCNLKNRRLAIWYQKPMKARYAEKYVRCRRSQVKRRS